MTRRLLHLAAAAAVAATAAACSDQPDLSAPREGPSLKPAPTIGCVFTGNPSLSNAANAYFTLSADKKTASDFIALMQAGYSATGFSGATDAGYSLLALTGIVSRQGTGSSPAAGAALTQQAVQCMYDVNAGLSGDFADWPTGKQFDFATALTPATGGTFYVRGGGSDGTGPVIGNDLSRIPVGGVTSDGNVSGLAPGVDPNTHTAVTWSDLLQGTRTLVYGNPVTNGYDWKLLPRNVVFRPYALVAMCPAARPGTPFTTSEMVAQKSVGVIGYKDAEAVCGTDPQLTMLQRGGVFAFAQRLASWAERALAPAPLQAAVALSTIGGSASGAKGDEFTVQDVPTVALTFSQKPPAQLTVNTGRFGVTINVATPPDPVGGVEVSLTAVNNNGTPTQLLQGTANGSDGCSLSNGATPVQPKITTETVGPDGTKQLTNVSWSNLCVTKTGALAIIATAGAVDRSGGVGTTTSTKMNVKP